MMDHKVGNGNRAVERPLCKVSRLVWPVMGLTDVQRLLRCTEEDETALPRFLCQEELTLNLIMQKYQANPS